MGNGKEYPKGKFNMIQSPFLTHSCDVRNRGLFTCVSIGKLYSGLKIFRRTQVRLCKQED